MKQISLQEAEAKTGFVRKAARYFEENLEGHTYGELEPGELFAIRWGLGNDCILVFRIDPECTLENFTQVIERESARQYTRAFDDMRTRLRDGEYEDE